MDLIPYLDSLPAKPIHDRNIAIIYRKGIRNQVIAIGKDHWFFLDFDSVYYCKGTSFDIVFLMESISKAEFVRDFRWESFFPQLKPDAVIMEAG